MKTLKNYYYKYVVGTYFVILKFEAGRTIVLQKYFAYSTFLAVILFQMFLYAAMLLAFGKSEVLIRIELNAIAMAIFCLVTWFSFIWRDKFLSLVPAYKDSRQSAERFAVLIDAVVIVVLGIATVLAVYRH